MARLSLLAACGLAVFAIGCGGDSDEGGDAPGGDANAGAAEPGDGGAMADEASSDAATVANRRTKRRANRRARRGRKIKVVSSQFGRVVADARGEAFYLFDKEKSKRSRCYGACARAWPPVITRGRPRAGRGIKGRLLGVTRRRNGKLQVTYGGHPLYYYVDDRPGLILCQNVAEFGGLWLVVKPDGNPVT